MQQNISELFADIRVIIVEKSVGELIDFLNSVRTQRFVGLLMIPRTFHTQDVESVNDAA